jgi:hypothetical protein
MQIEAAVKSIVECLETIGITSIEVFQGCKSFKEEFLYVKKAYFVKILASHPDKGGDSESFIDVQTSFDVLRNIYVENSESLLSYLSCNSTQTLRVPTWYHESRKDFEVMRTPSWDYFAYAAKEEVPAYRIELAKSNRCNCHQKGRAKKCDSTSIRQGDTRIGSIHSISGQYQSWYYHITWCERILQNDDK